MGKAENILNLDEINYNLHVPPKEEETKIEVPPPVIGKHIGTWLIVPLEEHLEKKKQPRPRLPCGTGT